MNELILLTLISAALYLWYSGLKARECALKAARHYCQRASVQLLDQTVQVTRHRLTRSSSGQLAIARRYGFEYCTDGDDRYQGSVEVIGHRAGSVWLQSRESDSTESSSAPPPETTARIIPFKPPSQDS
ncbi:DUF3301 domain-containing protein [Aestuariirhabdus litorea]|uniref:DUF3301 domain-containing protein n=1 Tax=Aestuariirhabdus litorea TaxID=2528527 RepID=A0A3P3VQQ2_9GAMM|nr:DUF3301 domain-containing protein [Aestuariirhabdus litorea]RRJ83859.1 DUF3301 domain-containing protein [Aestuariirhabdus litorea]RWW97082.1 DUF3301 domain-containing protein [Endozoicomonadaceae bacterium GTF-13]